MKKFYILPYQLFAANLRVCREYDKVYIVEDAQSLGLSAGHPRPNPIKVIFLLAAMHAHYEELRAAGVAVEWAHEVGANGYVWDPIDRHIPGAHVLTDQTPAFVARRTWLDEYYAAHPVRARHVSFYKFIREKVGVLVGVETTDPENRNPPPDAEIVDDFVRHGGAHYAWARTRFEALEKSGRYKRPPQPEGVDSAANAEIYPVTRAAARHALRSFIEERYSRFARYQDAIDSRSVRLCHAMISPMLNIGLLTPMEVIEAAMIGGRGANREAFVRQVLGWREYARYIYLYYPLKEVNHWRARGSVPRSWYTATTGIVFLDAEIKKAQTYGYAHHIVRLMIFLNMLTLMGVAPLKIYRWFMEVVSIDAWPWVMYSNIWMMSWAWPGGTYKPYLAGPNYIRRMSNYRAADISAARTGLWPGFKYPKN